MADFVIWGRVEQTAPGEFMAVASAFPVDLVLPGVTVESIMARNREDAVAFIQDAAIRLGRGVAERGDRVVDVEVDE